MSMNSNELIIEINNILIEYSTKFEKLLSIKDKDGLLSLCNIINDRVKEILNK